ncbi:hypothetical protein RCL1_004283 [Eukaryota sp. TZLM3-RCL]
MNVICHHCTRPLTVFTRATDTAFYNTVPVYSDSKGFRFRSLLLERTIALAEFQKIKKLNCRFTLRPCHLFLTCEGPLLFTEDFKYGTLSSLFRSGFPLSTRDLWLVVTQLLYSLSSLSQSFIDVSSLGFGEVVVSSLQPLRIKLCPVSTVSNSHYMSFIHCKSDPCSPLYPLTVCFHRILVELLRAAYPHHFGNVESLYSLSTSSLDFAGELFTLIQALDKSRSFNPVLLMSKIQECHGLIAPKKSIYFADTVIHHLIYQGLCGLKKPILRYTVRNRSISPYNPLFHSMLTEWTKVSSRFKFIFTRTWRVFLLSNINTSRINYLGFYDRPHDLDRSFVVCTCCSREELDDFRELFQSDSFFQQHPIQAIDYCHNVEPRSFSPTFLPHVNSITFSLHDFIGTAVLDESEFINSFTNLEELNITHARSFDFSTIVCANHLKSLSINQNGSTPAGLSLLNNLRSLYISSRSLTDLSFIQFMPLLNSLNLNETSVSELSYVSFSKKLRHCRVVSSKVSDISPLRYCRLLSSIKLNHNRNISDISPLAGLQFLEDLDLSYTSVKDVTALTACVQLRSLVLYRTMVTDFSPLGHFVNLHSLVLPSLIGDLPSCPLRIQLLWEFFANEQNLAFENFSSFIYLRMQVPSLQLLHCVSRLVFTKHVDVAKQVIPSCTQLQVLDVSGTSFSDLSLLSSCVLLQQLNASQTSITDLSSLQNCSELRSLNITCTKVSSLDPLSYCLKLRKLEAANTLVSDLFPLSQCSQLSHLDLRRTFVSRDYWKIFEDATTIRKLIATFEHGVTVELPRSVTDISPFSMCPRLISFTLTMSPLSDLSPLSHCPNLSYLNLSRTLVSDISALKSCLKLQTLNLSYCPVITIDSLSNCTMLKSLNIAATSVSDLTPLSNSKELSLIDVSFTTAVNGQELVVQGNREVQFFLNGLNY